MPSRDISESSVDGTCQGTRGSGCPILWASLAQVIPYTLCLQLIIFRYHYKLGQGEKNSVNLRFRGVTMLSYQSVGSYQKSHWVQENPGNQWPVQNWTFSSTRKREQKRENKKPSKKVKALRHHFGHLGTPSGSQVLNGLLIFWSRICSMKKTWNTPEGSPRALDGSFSLASCREVFNCLLDGDDPFYCVQPEARERQPLLGQVLHCWLFVISWPLSVLLLLSSLSSERKC